MVPCVVPASTLLAMAVVLICELSPISPVTLTVVVEMVDPAMVWLEVMFRSAPSVEPTRLLPVEVVAAPTPSVTETTSRVWVEKTSPSWIWLLMTSLGGVWAWLVPAAQRSAITGATAIVPAIRRRAGRRIVGSQVVVGRREAAGRAGGAAAERIDAHAGLRAGHAVEVGGHLDDGPLQQRADGQLDRFERAG